MNVNKQIVFFTLFFATSLNLFSQEITTKDKELSFGHKLCAEIASKIKLPIDTPSAPPALPPPPPSKWKGGTLLQLGFSQLSLTNWASGGYDNVSLNAFVNVFRNLEVNKEMFWENRLQIGYGFVQSFGDRYKKSDDKLIFDSKLGYKTVKNFFAAASFNFRSQMTNGYTYPANQDPIVISRLFAPAYFSLGLGMDYKPSKPLSINFSPLTGNLVIVTDENLRVRYGNKKDEQAKLELGAQFKMEYKNQISKNLTINTTLNLFSDYLRKPQNIKVMWDFFADSKIHKFFSINIRTNLIYDNEILIANKEGELAPRLQFKEILSVGFSYTIGDFKK